MDAVVEVYADYLRRDLPEAKTAFNNMEEDFRSGDSVGPVAVSQFVYGDNDAGLQADASAFVTDFIERVRNLLQSSR